jgi:hypothetical protein
MRLDPRRRESDGQCDERSARGRGATRGPVVFTRTRRPADSLPPHRLQRHVLHSMHPTSCPGDDTVGIRRMWAFATESHAGVRRDKRQALRAVNLTKLQKAGRAVLLQWPRLA